MRKRGKTSGELLVASGFALLALRWVDVSTHLSFTRQLDLDLGTWVWFAIAVIVIYGTSNAVNLTDGMDGLAAGSATLVFAAFMVICFWQFRHPGVYGVKPAAAVDLAVVAGALSGACGGFLWWNAAPARIFMGDTGSLAIGAGMAGLALLSKVVLLLPILGGLYVIETMSVIAQIISFRGFHRRVLRMAPIHHHFEVVGWPEFTVIVRFWLFCRRRRGPRARHLLCRLHPDPRGDRLMRVLVIGLAATGEALVRHLVARGDDVTVVEDTPGSGEPYASRAKARRLKAPSHRGPDPTAVELLVDSVDLVVPSPGVPEHHVGLAAAPRGSAGSLRDRPGRRDDAADSRARASGVVRDHRDERQDDGDDARHRDAGSCRHQCGRRQGTSADRCSRPSTTTWTSSSRRCRPSSSRSPKSSGREPRRC